MRSSAVTFAGVVVIGPAIFGIAPSAASPEGDAVAIQQQQLAVVKDFATAVVCDDPIGIAQKAAPGIVWTIPGASAIAGQVTGIDDVIRLADTFSQYDLHISPQGFLFGINTIAVKLHDTGERNGKRLDQDVVNILTVRDGKVATVTATLTDVSAFDAYFS